jgi:hypothetical protein
MKRNYLIGITAIALFIIMSGFASISYRQIKAQQDFWKQLGITEIEVKDHIKLCFLYESGLVKTLPVKNKIAIGDRAVIMLEAMKFAKQYVSTAEFEKEYQQVRESVKPKSYITVAKTKETIREESIKRNETAIQNLQNQLLLPTTDAFFKKAYTEHIVELKKEIEDYKKPNSLAIENAWRLEQENAKNLNERFKGSGKKWEINYPQNLRQVIKARLVQFLAQTNGIDYNAKLAERNGKQIFTNPAYEAKNLQWKMAFHAGKEVTETARTFIQQWLKELN